MSDSFEDHFSDLVSFFDSDALLAHQQQRDQRRERALEQLGALQSLGQRALAVAKARPGERANVWRGTRLYSRWLPVGFSNNQAHRVEVRTNATWSHRRVIRNNANGEPYLAEVKFPRRHPALYLAGVDVRVTGALGQPAERQVMVGLGGEVVFCDIPELRGNWDAAARFVGQAITAAEMYTRPDSDVVIDPLQLPE